LVLELAALCLPTARDIRAEVPETLGAAHAPGDAEALPTGTFS
jgi:hypothetical protein